MLIILIILLLVCGGIGPWWGYSRGWGYGPSGILGIILVIILVFAMTGGGGGLHWGWGF